MHDCGFWLKGTHAYAYTHSVQCCMQGDHARPFCSTEHSRFLNRAARVHNLNCQPAGTCCDVLGLAHVRLSNSHATEPPVRQQNSSTLQQLHNSAANAQSSLCMWMILPFPQSLLCRHFHYRLSCSTHVVILLTASTARLSICGSTLHSIERLYYQVNKSSKAILSFNQSRMSRYMSQAGYER